MEKTLNQRIHEIPLDIKQAIYDRGYEAGRQSILEQEEAKWIPVSTKPGVYAGMKCSLCKARISYSEFYGGNHNYCYKCGAKMIKNEDLENTFRTYAGVPGYEASDKENN